MTWNREIHGRLTRLRMLNIEREAVGLPRRSMQYLAEREAYRRQADGEIRRHELYFQFSIIRRSTAYHLWQHAIMGLLISCEVIHHDCTTLYPELTGCFTSPV